MERTRISFFLIFFNDQKTRSLLIQTATLILVLLFVYLILQNIAINLASVGKEFSFDFLTYPAGYDITFQPFVDYSPTDTHIWAGSVSYTHLTLPTKRIV